MSVIVYNEVPFQDKIELTLYGLNEIHLDDFSVETAYTSDIRFVITVPGDVVAEGVCSSPDLVTFNPHMDK